MLSEADILYQAQPILESLLQPIPFVKEVELKRDVSLAAGRRADFIASMYVANDELKLVGEVKRSLQPRFVLDAIRQVKEYCSYVSGVPVYPVVVSEYISARSAEILIDQNVSYFDLSGNCRLCFANVYIEKAGEKSKSGETRRVKSLFGLKSSRMLRLMLNNSIRPWQVKELVAKTELSLGQVSNIRRSLLDQQYAIESEQGGIQLNQPGALLGDWVRTYEKKIINKGSRFYSLLNSEERIEATREAISESMNLGLGIMLSGLSAARWQAPFSKSTSDSFYANEEGLEILKKHLKLEPVKIGPNVIIEEPKDSFVFKEAEDCAPGLKCTNVVQTYLDLYIAGEREREAALHIESHVLRGNWENNFKEPM